MMTEIQHRTDIQQGEIILYQPDETVRLEVRLEDDTVWLNQQQMADLFGTNRQAITKHLKNIYSVNELKKTSTCSILELVRQEGTRKVTRKIEFYNLDVIISVGFRVNTKRGIEFRTWANRVLKDHLLRGYSINLQMRQLSQKMDEQQCEIQKIEHTLADHQQKIDFFVRTNQQPVEGVLFEGQIFDAYKLVEQLVKSAKQEVILIDNYIDATIFDLLERRGQNVCATIYTEHVGQQLQHLQQLNQQQYGRRIEVRQYSSRFHDRFLIIDEDLYHFGASFKDLGKRLFAFDKMGIDKSVILSQL